MSTQQTYGQHEITRFVRLLGLWTYGNPAANIERRSDAEYAGLLKKLISVNKNRDDAVGCAETKAAQMALRGIKWEK